MRSLWIHAETMKFRNFVPLVILLLFTVLPGLGFLYLWLGNAPVLCGMQVFHAGLLYVTYRSGVHSAQKNLDPHLDLGRAPYLPLKVNLTFYAIVGLPLVFFYSNNLTVLMVAYGASILGFTLTYVSGVTYVVRSGPAPR